VERHGDGHDSLRPSSGNLDYLLEDEDEPKSGSGKLVLFVIALMLAVGFGYLRFKQGGFDFLIPGEKKPAVTADTSQRSADSGSATAATPDSNAAPAATGSAATSTAGTAAAKPADSSTAPATTPPSDSQTSAQAAPQATPQAAGSPAAAPPAAASQVPSAQAAPAQTSTADSSAAAETAAPSNTETEKPSAAPARARTHPAKPAAAAAKPPAGRYFDSVAEAERYIYGRGVAQDCDHGLRLLKPAAQQSDAKAMITLGALYSTGTCTPRDLPTAYRWFALALHKQPDNQTLQNDLQSLWSQMTPPERQLAIKLSQ